MTTIIPDMVFQEETNECGLACIAMLAQTQGHQASLDVLRERYPASDHGSSLNDLADVLGQMDIATAPVRFEHRELSELPFPAIIHYGASHYVLLAYSQGNYACVMNPAIGQQWLPLSALKEEISGYALILEDEQPPREPLPGGKKRFASGAASVMSLRQTAKVPGIYRLMLLTFLVSLTLFLMPIMVSNAINQAFSGTADGPFPYGAFIAAFAVATLLALGVRIISERYIKRFVLLNGAQGFSRMLNNPLRFFEKRAPGETFSRFVAWQGGLLQKIELDNGLRSDWVICTIALGVMFWIAPILALISALGVTVMGAISIWAVFRDRFYTWALQQKSAVLNDFFMETLQGALTIKSAGLENQRKVQFAWLSSELFTCLQRQKIYQQVKEGLYQLTGSLEMVLFMVVVLPMVHQRLISLGDFFAYSFLRQIFSSYVTRIFYAIIQKTQLQVIDSRAEALFKTPASAPLPPSPTLRPAAGHTPRLTFAGLCYGYDPKQTILHDICLDIPPGGQVAIVGESGAGKSTLLRIIAGLLTPNLGECRADGISIEARQLAQVVFLQSQEDILFNASVVDNVTLFDPHFLPEHGPKIEALLEELALGPAIRSLPGGIQALIRESHAGLSLGQRQRLLLARALYSQRPIMVLDEPTANLDDDTALSVISAIQSHCRRHGKTLIVVTHSFLILPRFETRYRLENGRLTQEVAVEVAV
ncbi:ABC transporter ATP-binding protein [Salmonella enterica subsp. enterica serovar Choleraesuis]|nr:ABC transporter ATP-binding protein [Salmonella enterica subsp. enterica serovar Choleraesuis]